MLTFRTNLQSQVCKLEPYFVFPCLEESKVTLGHLCMFATGRPQIGEIKVEFHTDKSKVMPKAATCPRVLTLPVCHHTYDDFKKQMDNALWFESEGFHLV